jgi:hypothetical protein
MKRVAPLLLCACGSAAGSGAVPAPGDAGEAGGQSCDAARADGWLREGEEAVVLRRHLDAGDRLLVLIEAHPAGDVVLVLESTSVDRAADVAAGPADPVSWTEFPQPLPHGVTRCPPAGCETSESSWVPPRLDRRVPVSGHYVLRLRATGLAVRWSACAIVEPAGTAGGGQ